MADITFEPSGDLVIQCGRTISLEIVLTASNAPLDLTGSSSVFIAKKAAKDTTNFVYWSSAGGQITHNGTGGKLTLGITPADTDTATINGSIRSEELELLYQWILTLSDGTVLTVSEGTLRLEKDFA